jgi:hypothetical protein
MLFGRNFLYHTREIIVVTFVLCACLALSLGLTLFKELNDTSPDGVPTLDPLDTYSLAQEAVEPTDGKSSPTAGYLQVTVRVNTLDPANYESKMHFGFTPYGNYEHQSNIKHQPARLKGLVRLAADCAAARNEQCPPTTPLRDGIMIDVNGKPAKSKEYETIPSRDQVITLDSGQFTQYPFDTYEAVFTIQAFDADALNSNGGINDVPLGVEVIAAVQSWDGTRAVRLPRNRWAHRCKTVAHTLAIKKAHNFCSYGRCHARATSPGRRG